MVGGPGGAGPCPRLSGGTGRGARRRQPLPPRRRTEVAGRVASGVKMEAASWELVAAAISGRQGWGRAGEAPTLGADEWRGPHGRVAQGDRTGGPLGFNKLGLGQG